MPIARLLCNVLTKVYVLLFVKWKWRTIRECKVMHLSASEGMEKVTIHFRDERTVHLTYWLVFSITLFVSPDNAVIRSSWPFVLPAGMISNACHLLQLFGLILIAYNLQQLKNLKESQERYVNFISEGSHDVEKTVEPVVVTPESDFHLLSPLFRFLSKRRET